MNIYIDIANEYISTIGNNDCGLVEKGIIEYQDVVYFGYQSKKFLETGNFSDMYVGQGPCFIIKNDHRIVTYGSAWWKEKALENLRKYLIIETENRKQDPEFDAFKDYYYLTQEDNIL